MDTLLSQYESELQHTETELQEVESQFQAISERKDELVRDRNALTQLISSRRKKLGDKGNGSGPNGSPQSLQYPRDGQVDHEPVGKSAFVWQLLQTTPGIKPTEIRRAARGKFELKKNFPYTILYGWKQSGRVEEKGGGYYPKK